MTYNVFSGTLNPTQSISLVSMLSVRAGSKYFRSLVTFLRRFLTAFRDICIKSAHFRTTFAPLMRFCSSYSLVAVYSRRRCQCTGVP